MRVLNKIAAATAAALVASALTCSAAWAASSPEEQDIAGDSRYDTASLIAQQWATENGQAKGVIVASGANYADALSASGLAGVLGYPIVLTDPNTAQSSTLGALVKIKDSKAFDVIIVGGTAAVGTDVERSLSLYDTDGTITRLAGSTRYETNDAILAYGASHGGWSKTALVATGGNYADALAASPYAYWAKAPVILTGGSLSDGSVSVLKSCNATVVLGGTAAISDATCSAVRAATNGSVRRLSGDTRYETGLKIAQWEILNGMSYDHLGFATGNNFPDALACSALLGGRGSVLALVDPAGNGNAGLLSALSEQAGNVESITCFGGTGALPQARRDEILQALTPHDVSVGDYVTFGTYEQDNDTSNGAESIRWRVLDIVNGKALLVSQYALECLPYDTIYANITWKGCSLRQWLNSTFISTAFTASEQKSISTINHSNPANPDYPDVEVGEATDDTAFLLSCYEVDQYFSGESDRMCAPTAYAAAKGAKQSSTYTVGGSGTCSWWLRTAGRREDHAEYVVNAGSFNTFGISVSANYLGVRPALWADLEAVS